jgi:pre-rRNA-processing protein TSR1
MMVEEVRWPSGKAVANEEGATGEVVITGVIRGRGLKADRLVQVGDWGDYQIEKIEAAPQMKSKKARDGGMAIDLEGDGEILEIPTEDQDDLEELAPEEVVMGDADYNTTASTNPLERKGVLIDDHYYYSDEERFEPIKPKRLPRGTSNYQAAWYIGDVSDSGSDMEDVEDAKSMALEGPSQDPADGPVDIDMRDPTEAGETEYPQSEAFQDPSPDDEADQIAAYRKQRHEEAEVDLEFPDEIELPPTALARDRLLRYRGLKNLRTSVWDTEEDRSHEPEEWRRLLEIANYKSAKNRMLKESLTGGVQPGMRVRVFLKAVPLTTQDLYDATKPLAMYSLLRHEHKRTAVNYSITLSSNMDDITIKSKQEIIAQCGPRRFVINPLFSNDANTPNDVHKFKRFLHPGQSAVASFTGPLTWGAVPVLYFRYNTTTNVMETDDQFSRLTLIGTGTSLPPSHTRVIAKRLILTGHPFKIHRRVVTVRYMFFNAEDVAWFKALRLWTKRGRSGYIKQSLGTHGYFKATFDGKIDPQDAVAVSLYKRVWPRQARPFGANTV